MSLALGLNILESAEIAWEAGVVYVKNKYNQPLHPNDFSTSKIVDPQFLTERNFKLVFTNGCFDILHAGHLESLKFAKFLGDKLVVAVNTDESVAENKPGRPFVKLKDRMSLLASLEFVDYVVSFSEKTPLEILKTIRPDVVVKGSEYSKENIVGNDFIPEVVVCPMIEGLSTTNLINSIKNSQTLLNS
jgi:D-beta-D-heptose 7-phosphate kinase/D-beta-D-heptose 1-phosphate adenosyltransferase